MMIMLKRIVLSLLFVMTAVLYANTLPVLHVGHLLYGSVDASPKDIKTTLGLWMQELGLHIGMQIEAHFYDSVDMLEKDFTAGKLDYILINPLDLIKNFDLEEHIEGFSPSRDGANQHNTLALLVRNDLQIKTIHDLQGKRVGVQKDDEVGRIYLDVLLMEEGLSRHQAFFSKVIIEKKHSKILLKLFFNKIDAAVVTKGTLELVNEMNPQVGDTMHILEERSVQMGMASIFHKDIDPKIIEKFEHSIKTLHENKRAKQILMLFKADRLERFSKSDSDELKALYERYQTLKEDRSDREE